MTVHEVLSPNEQVTAQLTQHTSLGLVVGTAQYSSREQNWWTRKHKDV